MKILRYIHNMCDSDDKAVEFSLGELLEVDNKASAPTDPPGEEMTALHSAASSGNAPLVKILLQNGEDPAQMCGKGWTSLHHAVKSGDVQTVRLLLEWGDKRLLKMTTKNCSSTPLHIAAQYADREICKLLVDCGVDAQNANKRDENALHVACRAGNLDVVQYFTKIFDFYKRNSLKMNLLHYAARSNHLHLIEFLFLEKGIGISDKNVFGHTPLLTAVAFGSLKVIKFFVENGGDLKESSTSGFDALFIASKTGKLDVVQYLLSRGIFDVNRKNKSGLFPLLVATIFDNLKIMEHLLDAGAEINARGTYQFTACLAAAYFSNVDTLKFLVERGANLNVTDSRLNDPFQLACQSDDLDKIKYLAGIGKCDLKRRNKNGKTAWLKSAKRKSLELKRLLIELGANIHDTDRFNLGGMVLAAQFSTPESCQFMLDIGLRFDVLTKDGGNALHQACVSGNLATAKFLLGLKCLDVNATMNGGQTALIVAASRGHFELVKLLLDNGADINVRNDYGGLAIHAAAAVGDCETVEYLLTISEGSQLEERTKRGETPLLLSCLNTNTNVFHHLLKSGANLQAVDYAGKNVFLSACLSRNGIFARYLVASRQCDPSAVTKYGENAVHFAAKSGNTNILKFVIQDLKLDVNHRAHNGKTPLMVTAEFGSAKTCRYLIENGADVQTEMKNGENALFCACVAKNVNLVKVKLIFEACKIRVENMNNFGLTAFHLVVRRGLLEAVKFFIEEVNADVEGADNNGWNLLHVAAKFAPLEINKYIVNANESLLHRPNLRNQLPKDLAEENEDFEVLPYFYDKMKIQEQPLARTGVCGPQNAADNLMLTLQNRDNDHSLLSFNWRT